MLYFFPAMLILMVVVMACCSKFSVLLRWWWRWHALWVKISSSILGNFFRNALKLSNLNVFPVCQWHTLLNIQDKLWYLMPSLCKIKENSPKLNFLGPPSNSCSGGGGGEWWWWWHALFVKMSNPVLTNFFKNALELLIVNKSPVSQGEKIFNIHDQL